MKSLSNRKRKPDKLIKEEASAEAVLGSRKKAPSKTQTKASLFAASFRLEVRQVYRPPFYQHLKVFMSHRLP